MRIALPLIALLAVTACSQEPAPDANGDTAPTPAATVSGTPADEIGEPEPTPVAGRTYRYTPLENCELVREEREEMPFTEVRCGGAGGWDIVITDADARQVMVLDGPGEKHTLDTTPVAHGAFSSFGKTAEWRGADVSGEPGGHFEPDSLIVRFDYAQQPHPAPERSDLLVVRLGRDPCIVAAVAPGPGQNDAARKIADSGRGCPAG